MNTSKVYENPVSRGNLHSILMIFLLFAAVSAAAK